MDLTIKGNPGTSNQYNDIRLGQTGSYNPAAKDVHNYFYAPEPTENRLTVWFRNLDEEFKNDRRLDEIRSDIKAFKTKLPKTIGLRQKLADGGFGNSFYDDAKRQKLQYCKKSMRYQYFESAQRIDSYLLAKVKSNFDTYVMPLIGSKSKHEVKQAIYEKVVTPIMDEINRYGTDDTCLTYTDTDIYGMLYMLTGNCHINWKDYDDDINV